MALGRINATTRFCFGCSGAALAMLDIVRAQQVARVWRVGYVGIEPRDRVQYLIDVFSKKLAEFGYQQGRNIDLTEHLAEARIEKIERASCSGGQSRTHDHSF
jgi:hypothetical protein